MIRTMLKQISGTTLNTELSPDQSVAQGAAFYAGMLLSGQAFKESSLSHETATRLAAIKQQNVCARALGILVRDRETDHLDPCYLVPANSPLPCEFKQIVGTLVRNQRRVHLHIVESGASPGEAPVELGFCLIQDLPPNLPEKSPVEVTIRYDEQARVRVRAKEMTSGKEAQAVVVRPENVIQKNRLIVGAISGSTPKSSPRVGPARSIDLNPLDGKSPPESARHVIMPAIKKSQSGDDKTSADGKATSPPTTAVAQSKPTAKAPTPPKVSAEALWLEQTERPIPLCNDCGGPLSHRGECPRCGPSGKARSGAKPSAAGSAKGNKGVRSGKSEPKPGSKKTAVSLARGSPRKPIPAVSSTDPTDELSVKPRSELSVDDYWGVS